MNDRHPEIADWMATYAKILGPEEATEQRQLHVEGLYSGFDGTVGPGWMPLLDRLVADLVEMGWDRDLHQVKSKFHTLRFYVGHSTKRMVARIRAAEAESGRTCCECGAKVTLRRDDPDATPGWCRPCLARAVRGGDGRRRTKRGIPK